MNIMKCIENVITLRGMERFFVDKYGDIYSTDEYCPNEFHESLAKIICAKNGWDYREFTTAETFLLEKKGFIKVSNYGSGLTLKYIAYGKSFSRNKDILDSVYWLSYILRLRIEKY